MKHWNNARLLTLFAILPLASCGGSTSSSSVRLGDNDALDSFISKADYEALITEGGIISKEMNYTVRITQSAEGEGETTLDLLFDQGKIKVMGQEIEDWYYKFDSDEGVFYEYNDGRWETPDEGAFKFVQEFLAIPLVPYSALEYDAKKGQFTCEYYADYVVFKGTRDVIQQENVVMTCKDGKIATSRFSSQGYGSSATFTSYGNAKVTLPTANS